MHARSAGLEGRRPGQRQRLSRILRGPRSLSSGRPLRARPVGGRLRMTVRRTASHIQRRDLDKRPRFRYKDQANLAHVRDAIARVLLTAGASAVPACGPIQSAPGQLRASCWPALRPVREVLSLDWDRRARVTPVEEREACAPRLGRPYRAGRPAASHMWTAPCLQGSAQSTGRSDCDHMSGLLSRSHMTAAKMGSATRVPNRKATFLRVGHWDSRSVSRLGIDRSRHLLRLEQAPASTAGRQWACR